jgi:hypothetical protein
MAHLAFTAGLIVGLVLFRLFHPRPRGGTRGALTLGAPGGPAAALGRDSVWKAGRLPKT